MLTKKLKQVLDFIGEYQRKKEYSPALEEIRRHFKLASVSTAYFHVKRLEELGYLTRQKNQPRAIELQKEIKEKLVEIPLVGTIAAGEPIEAIEDLEAIKVPKSQLSKSGEHYALRVRGDSMIDERICDGDTVIIRKQPDAENGETVVALINDNEVTLKKIYKEKEGFRLQPANPNLKPLFTKELTIQGKVISVIRNFEERLDYIKNLEGFKSWFILKTFSCAPYADGNYNLNSLEAQREMDKLLPLYIDESQQVMSIVDIGQLPDQMKKLVSFFGTNFKEESGADEKLIKNSRRSLGQFMTPNFLVEHILQTIKDLYPNKKYQTILDPGCGTGNFLVGAAKFLGKQSRIIGFDIDPLNLLIAYSQIKSINRGAELYWIDTISPGANKGLLAINNSVSLLETLLLKNNCRHFANFLKTNIQTVKKIKADLIIGNPPWINFNDLSPIYKEATKPDWVKYGLISKSGFSLLLGSGKADLSFLFTYKIIDEYLKDNGIYGLVLPQSAFRASDAASGFRKFESLLKKFYFSVEKIDDFDKIKTFEDAQIASCTVIGQKQVKTKYPINYYVWSKKTRKNVEKNSDISSIKKLAYPLRDELNGIFLTLFDKKMASSQMRIYGKNYYTPRQGINTGGANGIFIDKSRNFEKFLSSNIFKSELMEPDLVYPLPVSSDIKKWRVSPSAIILLPYQKKDPKQPVTLSDLKINYRNTLRYLEKYKSQLIKRNSVGFKNKSSFFSFFGVGDYTFSNYKVIWNSLGARKFMAAVARPIKGKPIIPNQALQTYIATDDINEAFYICGLLNSRLISQLIENLGHQGGKSFAQPSQIKKIKLLTWDKKKPIMNRIGELAREAHLHWNNTNKLKRIEKQLEKYVNKLYSSISS